jgi:hypothetical protein
MRSTEIADLGVLPLPWSWQEDVEIAKPLGEPVRRSIGGDQGNSPSQMCFMDDACSRGLQPYQDPVSSIWRKFDTEVLDFLVCDPELGRLEFPPLLNCCFQQSSDALR